jgi:hypothetical protein
VLYAVYFLLAVLEKGQRSSGVKGMLQEGFGFADVFLK